MSDKERIDYRFKILYAIGIILIVCGHVNGGGISILSDWFPYYGFHLALFMFGSGYFYKSSAEDNIWKYSLRKIKTLIIPMYLYNCVYGVIVQILKLKDFEIGGDLSFKTLFIMPINNGQQFVYNLGGWFIIPLFMVEIYNVCIRKLLKKRKKDVSEWIFFLISLLLGICGNQLACMGYNDENWLVLVRMLYFVPFYAFGVLYKNKLERYDRKIQSRWYFTILFSIKLAIILYFGKNPTYIPSSCSNFTDGPIMPVIIGLLGIALWLRIAIILEPVIGKSKLVLVIADNTYSIMMNHLMGFMIVKSVYAIINKLHIGCSDFDWLSYKTDIWWYYTLRGISQSLIVYVVVGLVFPIIVQKWLDATRQIAMSTFLKDRINSME